MTTDILQDLLHKLREAQALPDIEQAVEIVLLSYVTKKIEFALSRLNGMVCINYCQIKIENYRH